jgi:hypothetical protein
MVTTRKTTKKQVKIGKLKLNKESVKSLSGKSDRQGINNK